MSTHADVAPTFHSLGLSNEAVSALLAAGHLEPTPIQTKAIPPALSGSDVVGCAATGTGKTAAFLLPLLERLSTNHGGSRALILAPTRELATQIADSVHRYRGSRRIRCATLIGGVSMKAQMLAVKDGAQLLVATPGRLIDHLEQGTAKLDGIEVLVLDEADRMLDMGFKPQLTRILARVPRSRQTLLFSATVGGEVAQFAKQHLRDPVRVEVSRSGTTAARAEQRVYLVNQNEKTALLLALLGDDKDSTLVFTRTKMRADRLARALERSGHLAARIHADRSQSQRQGALEGFRRGKFKVLVATDIAARGIDVAEIAHVVNFDLPHVPADYVHRVGRTARASASGRASSFAAPDEMGRLRDIERFTRTPLQRAELPTDSLIFQTEIHQRAERQADPGPPQKQRPSESRGARPPGRHARTHRKHGSAQGATVAFSGGPKHRR